MNDLLQDIAPILDSLGVRLSQPALSLVSLLAAEFNTPPAESAEAPEQSGLTQAATRLVAAVKVAGVKLTGSFAGSELVAHPNQPVSSVVENYFRNQPREIKFQDPIWFRLTLAGQNRLAEARPGGHDKDYRRPNGWWSMSLTAFLYTFGATYDTPGAVMVEGALRLTDPNA